MRGWNHCADRRTRHYPARSSFWNRPGRDEQFAIGAPSTLESVATMKTWLRLLLVTMTVGGGFSGITLSLEAFHHPSGPTQLFLDLLFLILFSFVTASGLIFVWNPNRTAPLIVALAIQIPWISCPVFEYHFSTGLLAAITLGTPENPDQFGLRLGTNLFFGSLCRFRFGAYHEIPLAVGVNTVALVLLILLLRETRSPKAHSQREIEALPDSAAV